MNRNRFSNRSGRPDLLDEEDPGAKWEKSARELVDGYRAGGVCGMDPDQYRYYIRPRLAQMAKTDPIAAALMADLDKTGGRGPTLPRPPIDNQHSTAQSAPTNNSQSGEPKRAWNRWMGTWIPK